MLLLLLIAVIYKRNYETFTPNNKHPIVDGHQFDLFLINLPISTHRRTNFESFYNEMEHKVPYHYLEAVDAQQHQNTVLFQTWPNLKNTHHGTKALQLSNIQCFKQALLLKCEWVIICEDDAELPKNINFEDIVNKYHDSKVIYLDNRNRCGDGYVPGCCTNCVMYHNSVIRMMITHLEPSSKLFIQFANVSNLAVYDFYLNWLLHKLNVKTSSHPIVNGHKFETTFNLNKPTLVIAHYKEDLTWMNDYNLDEFNVEIYMKYHKPPISSKYKCISLQNVGRETHSYLSYIINNYTNLPETILFTLAGISSSRIKKKKFEYIYNKHSDCITKGFITYPQFGSFQPLFKLNQYSCTTPENGCTNSNVVPANVRPFGNWYQTYIKKDLSHIQNQGVSFNGIFAVSADSIRKYPLELYMELLSQVELGDNLEVSHFMERSYKSMFII
jgi:hypothetical protein